MDRTKLIKTNVCMTWVLKSCNNRICSENGPAQDPNNTNMCRTLFLKSSHKWICSSNGQQHIPKTNVDARKPTQMNMCKKLNGRKHTPTPTTLKFTKKNISLEWISAHRDTVRLAMNVAVYIIAASLPPQARGGCKHASFSAHAWKHIFSQHKHHITEVTRISHGRGCSTKQHYVFWCLYCVVY